MEKNNIDSGDETLLTDAGDSDIIDEAFPAEEETPPPAEEAAKEFPDYPMAPRIERRRSKRRFIPAVALGIILLLIGGVLVYGAIPTTVEAGETASLKRLDALPFLSSLIRVDTDVSAINTQLPGEHEVRLTYFGFLPLTTKLIVQDTVPPEFTVRELCVKRGIELSPEDFIVSVNDRTPVTFTFVGSTDTTNPGSLTIKATDAGGNETVMDVPFTVSDALSSAVFEFGINPDEMLQALEMLEDFEELGVNNVDTFACGTYRASGRLDGVDCLFEVIIRDTTAPTAIVSAYDVLRGQTMDIYDFVSYISDASEVTASWVVAPDFDKVGAQTLSMILEDAAGNCTDYTTELRVHNLSSSLVIEAGTDTASFTASVHAMLGSDAALPRLRDDFETDHLAVGTYETELIGEFSIIPLEIIVADTVAPRVTLHELTVYTGNMPGASDFVSSCIDESAVSFSYESTPDVSAEASVSVTILATDSGGNITRETTTLHVTKNRIPPVITGVRNLSAYEGESLSYRSGVSATDDLDGKVTVKIDASNVKTSKAGTYYVTYTATDSDGNTATATAKVTIMAINVTAAYSLADQVLAEITTSSMNDRQKARAIYEWCTETIRYSTSTSHLMGQFAKAAYSGFRVHYGNCYTYYAVASALLTRAGISNIEIQRNDPDNPHYWNLVNIDGNWYHFDTCPQPSPHKLEVFLLTSDELDDFTKAGYYSFDAAKYPETP